MKNYYRIMLGQGSSHAATCIEQKFIGADYDIEHDLTGKLPEEWKEFNKAFIPKFLETRPEKSKIAAGLACGMLWTISKGIKIGEKVLCPDGTGQYHVGEVTGEYSYQPGGFLPHRRPVRWLSQTIDRTDMSDELKRSTSSTGTVCRITKYHEELERLIGGDVAHTLISTDESIEDPSTFAMEKHLEDFLVQNWEQTPLGSEYDIYEDEGEKVGKQYQTDTGPLDILAISKDQKKLLVVELKKGRASDGVVGQTLRYMGYVQDQLAEEGQTVKGVIIALEDDQRLQRAISMVPAIDFYRYQISFKLLKV